MARQFHGETQVPTLPSSKKGKVCNSRSSGVGGRIKQDDKCSSVVVLFIWTPELQHDEGLIEYFHSPESFFGWEVICQALMRRTMQPWLINLSIYRDCSSPCPHASEQWACCCLTFTGAWQCWQLFRSFDSETLRAAGRTGGKWIRARFTLLKAFWGNHRFRVVGSICIPGAFPPRTVQGGRMFQWMELVCSVKLHLAHT